MTEPEFPFPWKIVGSTSGLFPVLADLDLFEVEKNDFEFRVRKEGKERRFRLKLPDVTDPEEDTEFKGDGPDNNSRKVELTATLCPGEVNGPRYLCGHVVRPGRGRGDGATGVWVAEEDRPPTGPPPKR